MIFMKKLIFQIVYLIGNIGLWKFKLGQITLTRCKKCPEMGLLGSLGGHGGLKSKKK